LRCDANVLGLRDHEVAAALLRELTIYEEWYPDFVFVILQLLSRGNCREFSQRTSGRLAL